MNAVLKSEEIEGPWVYFLRLPAKAEWERKAYSKMAKTACTAFSRMKANKNINRWPRIFFVQQGMIFTAKRYATSRENNTGGPKQE
jgi:hypothetical protein